MLNSSSLSVTGNSGINSLIGNSGANTLNGGDGADVMSGGRGNDTLIGGRGIDRLSGGPGDDTYVIDGDHDLLIESAGGGSDLIRSPFSYTLAANFERLLLLGAATALAPAMPSTTPSPATQPGMY